MDWGKLQNRRLVIEQQGPAVEEVPPMFIENKDADMERICLIEADALF
ncbi:hypothetical protein L1N85_11085 [Paenibacillus alkaliterrae]|nr:hypothetical protein [Paenibacillus alkaliterrae]MCF2938980.1 hypothetical protein [Paenibacillus alkaliterrae]